ncbi:pyrroline-5-carboxylate reductase [Arsenicitalea aurantiaca]|uniref:Pyrroline-5-carboxylate reductase n=1 Tax=Arsenicitalea aurantiaca TaxID=1783274 RepID=A0A433XLL3_9HYPH|nr:pyrroline-5-carboxylate reductase [Arsenicitalea aurantiaca]RUT34970.1 pyrroline-5-carboxylate reductase [Arsenicitalea aurantiaca]
MTLSEIGPVVLLGAGKMGLAMARGWIVGGLPPSQLVLVDPQPSADAEALAQSHGIRLQDTAEGVLIHVLVLAVKPQIISQVMAEVRDAVGPHTLVISIAAGISLKQLGQGLGTERVIRAMPNTPAQIGKGITGAVGGDRLMPSDIGTAGALLGAAGQVLWFEREQKLDAVTSVSGSGPAYVFHLVEALAAAGVRQGLEAGEAMLLARQTVIGSAALMEADPAPAQQLRENVTSPKGTTAAALAVLMGPEGLEALMDRAVTAACRRSEELGRS